MVEGEGGVGIGVGMATIRVAMGTIKVVDMEIIKVVMGPIKVIKIWIFWRLDSLILVLWNAQIFSFKFHLLLTSTWFFPLENGGYSNRGRGGGRGRGWGYRGKLCP